jgi:transposase
MSDVTSADPTAVLFGLEGEFGVLGVQRIDPGAVKMIIEQAAREGPCPACGVLTATVKERPMMRLKDLPASGQTVQLWWRKRRLICAETLCPQQTFTQAAAAVRPRGRVTERLREKVATAIASSNRAVADVAREYGVSWPTAHQALVSQAARWLPVPEPTARLGIDETRFRSVRWILDGITWRRSDPWLTSFVDCSRDGPGSLLGLAPGRTGACVKDWLAEQNEAFRRKIEIVVIDPSAPYASGIRAALPQALIAVDKWHLVALANQMVTEVRQRVTRDLLGRRGTLADSVWVNRRLLLTGAEHLSAKQWRQLTAMLDRWTRRRRSAPPGPSKNASGCCWPNVSHRRSAGGWPTSTRPRSTPSCPRPPGWPRPSKPGGQPSWLPSPKTSPTPAPKDSTGSSSRPNASAVGSGHSPTISVVSSPTSRSPDRRNQQHEPVTPPLKFVDPGKQDSKSAQRMPRSTGLFCR